MAEGRFSKLERKSSDGFGPLTPPDGAVSRDSKPAQQVDQDDPALYPSFILQADEAFFTGDYREALRFYSRALQQENNHVYPWIGQISSLLALKQYREAELWSNKALEQFPEDSSILSQRARSLAATGNVKRAIGVCDFAMSKGATEWTWLARGEVLLEAGDTNAMFCFEKAVEEAGLESWRVPLMAGIAFARKRQWSNAYDYLRRSAERNQHNFYVLYELARVQIELSYFDKARDTLSRCRQLKPEFKPAMELERKLYRRPFFKRLLGVLRR